MNAFVFFFLFKMIYFSFVVMFLYVIHFFQARQYQNEKKNNLWSHTSKKKTPFVLYGHKYNTKLIYPVCEHWTEILYSENTTDTWFHPKKSFLSISVKFKSVTTFLCVLVDRGSGWGQRSSDGKADTVW